VTFKLTHFNFAGWRSCSVPSMHHDHNALPSQTDRQTDTDMVA